MNERPPEDLQDRIQMLLDGTLETAEIHRLDAELQASREARDLFRQFATLHSVLEEQGESKPQMGRAMVQMERMLADQRRTMVRNSLMAAAAVVLIGGLVLWVKMIPENQTAALGNFRLGSGTLFTLAHAEGKDSAAGNALHEGSRLRLSQGTVEVSLNAGVRCVVEGPADLKLIADDRVQLSEGSAWFEVRQTAVGFTVETPQLTAVDLGTDFGVVSRPNQGDQVHVINGSVSVRAAGAGRNEKPLLLKEGDACEVDASGGFRKIDIHPDQFVTALPNPITFVDADVNPATGNTVLDGPGSFGPTTSEISRTNDGKWSVRIRDGVSGGSILVSGLGEDAEPRLRTTFRLPEPGRYAIFGYFWNNQYGDGFWNAAFQLGSHSRLIPYSRLNAVNLSSAREEFTSTVPTDDGAGQFLFQASLGFWDTSTHGIDVTVYIDNADDDQGANDVRTWYDGIGYRRLPDR